jgi:hypothetical protein
LFKQAVGIATIAIALTIFLTLWPVAVQATDSTNMQVKLDGVLHFAFERPCVVQVRACSPTGGEVPYLTTLNGDNYQLLGVQPAYLEDTKLVVTGWLQAPSGSTDVLSPALIFAGAITVTSLYAHCEKHLG